MFLWNFEKSPWKYHKSKKCIFFSINFKFWKFSLTKFSKKFNAFYDSFFMFKALQISMWTSSFLFKSPFALSNMNHLCPTFLRVFMFIIKRVIGLEIGVHNRLWFICVHLVRMCLQHWKSVELNNVNLTKVIYSYVLKMMDACCMKYHKKCSHLCWYLTKCSN